MAKINNSEGKVKRGKGQAKRVGKGGKPPASVAQRKPKTGRYAQKGAEYIISEPIPICIGDKIEKPVGKRLLIKVKGINIGSVLLQSATRPESRLTAMQKMEATQEGISKKELEQLKEKAVLDYDQLSYILDVSRASLIAKKGAEKFSTSLSEKIMSLADIYSYGYEVFGSEQEFNKWIFQPIAAFGGKAPYEVLNNQYGREEVKHVIGRIDYGVYS